MYIGSSLFLIAAGAILAWAVDVDWKSFDLAMAGYIIFGVGVLALLISFYMYQSKRKRMKEIQEMASPRPGRPAGPGGPGGPASS